MEEIVGDLLRRSGFRLSVAESCTGGLLGHRLTNIPGSSDYFLGGVISYANQAKVELLGVSEETLTRHGAVSRQT
ncbi:MAG TPA: nicotinamide-nucleotide amidohydrolase family protein, partial [Anaerolineales bacterium]|nr:nicotinamide-nucleotide amidohydrolase family protein [Anaerolineales bacterium]